MEGIVLCRVAVSFCIKFYFRFLFLMFVLVFVCVCVCSFGCHVRCLYFNACIVWNYSRFEAGSVESYILIAV